MHSDNIPLFQRQWRYGVLGPYK